MPGTTFGGMGKLEWSPTTAPDDPNPVYVDITLFVRTEETPLIIQRGRQSELDIIQSSQLTAVLDNTDNRFTTGYTGGPYGANWITGKRIRYSETVAGLTFILFTGYLEFPDVDSWQPIGYQEVQLTAVDRLTRLGRGKPFVSTLGAHIMGSVRNGCLKGYWPLNDATQPFAAAVGTLQPILSVLSSVQAAVPTFQTGLTLPGDDAPSLHLTWDTTSPVAPVIEPRTFDTFTPLTAGQVVTIVGWVNVDTLNLAGLGAVVTNDASPTTPSQQLFAQAVSDANGSHWAAIAGGDFIEAPIGTANGTSRWYLVGLRFGFTPNVLEIWVDNTSYSTTFATVYTFTNIYAAFITAHGNMVHHQLYVGAPADFTFADFTAQRAVGLTGLEYQATGQRINSILDYAGVSATDRLVDAGVSVMAPATLAGMAPADALALAVATERGRGFISGDGKYVFQDRIHTYNV